MEHETLAGKYKWVKLNMGMDQKSGTLILAEVSKEYVHDTAYLEKALKSCNQRKRKILFHRIADSKRCYELCRKRNKKLLIREIKGQFFTKKRSTEKEMKL